MRLYFIFIALLACTSVFAQQHFFLYIQTENKQPFYIKMNNKVYSSSATGYIVVPKLLPDTYQMTVGFNKDVYPEQQFLCIVDKDAGYLLKNYGEKGWGFLNLQNGEIVMSGGVKKPGDDEDAFTKTLSQVVNTPDLKSEEKKEVKKETQPEIKPKPISLLLNNKNCK